MAQKEFGTWCGAMAKKYNNPSVKLDYGHINFNVPCVVKSLFDRSLIIMFNDINNAELYQKLQEEIDDCEFCWLYPDGRIDVNLLNVLESIDVRFANNEWFSKYVDASTAKWCSDNNRARDDEYRQWAETLVGDKN